MALPLAITAEAGSPASRSISVSGETLAGNGWLGASRNGAALAMGNGADVAATAAGFAVANGATVADAGLVASDAAQALSVTMANALQISAFFIVVPLSEWVFRFWFWIWFQFRLDRSGR